MSTIENYLRLEKLPDNGRPPKLTPEQESRLNLRASEVNIDWLIKTMHEKIGPANEHAKGEWQRASCWAKDFVSLKDIPDFEKRFNYWTGAICLPEIPTNSPYSEFFNKPGRTHKNGGRVENRGARYYLPTDPEIGTPEQKLAVLREDFGDALKVLQEVDRKKMTPDELLLFLGVLDYLKQDSLALYHVIIEPEKEGFPEQPGSAQSKLKEEAFALAKTFTRIYYQSLYGRKLDSFPSRSGINDSLEKLGDYIDLFLSDVTFFKLPELSHPLRIAISSDHAAHTNLTATKIIALPRGSTEAGIVTQLALEFLQSSKDQTNRPDLVLIPVSLYSKKTDGKDLTLAQRFEYYLKLNKLDKLKPDDEVLIVDDNANTARTITALLEAEGKQPPINDIVVFEMDPVRIMNMSKKGKMPELIANFLNPELRFGALWIVPVLKHKYEKFNTYEYRKVLARKILLAGMGKIVFPKD